MVIWLIRIKIKRRMSSKKTTKKKIKDNDECKLMKFRQVYSEKRFLGIWKENSKLLGKELETWVKSKHFLETELESEDKKFNVIEQLLRNELSQVEEDNEELDAKRKASDKLYKKCLLELEKCTLYPQDNENAAYNKEELDRMKDEKVYLQTKLKELKEIKESKKRLEKEMRKMELDLDNAIASKNLLLAEKEKERIKANEWNKKEMIKKIQEADNSLQKMKKREVETTKKLSILQNFQLNMELDSHSKKIDKLIRENKKLQNQLNELFLDIGSYKGVEKDFYRQIEKIDERSHKAQEKIKKLEKEVNSMQNSKKNIEELFTKSKEQFQNFMNKKVRLTRQTLPIFKLKKRKSNHMSGS
jgi:chromosome segregation ATPase